MTVGLKRPLHLPRQYHLQECHLLALKILATPPPQKGVLLPHRLQPEGPVRKVNKPQLPLVARSHLRRHHQERLPPLGQDLEHLLLWRMPASTHIQQRLHFLAGLEQVQTL